MRAVGVRWVRARAELEHSRSPWVLWLIPTFPGLRFACGWAPLFTCAVPQPPEVLEVQPGDRECTITVRCRRYTHVEYFTVYTRPVAAARTHWGPPDQRGEFASGMAAASHRTTGVAGDDRTLRDNH